MTNIPLPYRAAAVVAVLAVVLAIGAAGGATVATWKAEAGHSIAIQAKDATILRLESEKTELKLAVAEQNKGVAVAAAQTQAAEAAQAQAQKHADDMASFSKSRMDKLERFIADTSEQVLKAYWELRK